jgi:SNF2 family DNA or RNA helicase
MLSSETERFVKTRKAARVRNLAGHRLVVDITDEGDRFAVTVYDGDSWPSFVAREFLEGLTGSKRCESGDRGHSVYLPVGFFAVLTLQYAFEDRIEFAQPFAELQWKAILTQFIVGEKRAEINGEWIKDKKVPKHNLKIAEGVKLLPYQEVAAQLAYMSDSFAFFMEQGTGKTPTAITTLGTWIDESDSFQRIIVVCPRNVCFNWISEIHAFSPVPVKTAVIRGGEIKRLQKLAAVMKPEEGYQAGIAVINYEGVMTMGEIFAHFDWDAVVLDEAHFIKSSGSKRTKYFLHKMREKAKKRLILTGTPIANTPIDLWSQFEFLGPATSGFGTLKGFKDFYARVRTDQESGFSQIVGMQNVPVLQEVLARNSFIIRKEDAMPWLPEKLYSVETIEMGKSQTEMYRQIATELAVEIENDMDDEYGNKSLLVNNILTKLLRLGQITSGFVSWDPVVDAEGNVLRPRIIEDLSENPKIDWCVEAIKNHPRNEKINFWSWMTHDIDALSNRLDEEGIEYVRFTGGTGDEQRQEAERRFNTDPDCRVFIGNPAAGGTGLNLLGHDPKNPDDYDTDATMSVYIAQNWNAVHRSQSEDRNHRRGTRKPVKVVTLACPGTIDEDIHERVTSKRKVALELSDIRCLLTKLIGDIA